MIHTQTIFLLVCLLFLSTFELPVLANPSKKWSKQEWAGATVGGSRAQLFAQLLKQRNLIGLSQQKIEHLIGTPDNDGLYRLSSYCCGGIVLRIEYEKKHVQRWRLESWGTNGNAALVPEPWIETNVVFNHEQLIPLDVTPKSRTTLNSKKLNS